tara:strand:- start:739 stop:987 length:249 start_codon:yes stop_codon:yes gene_type:complete
MANDNHSNPTAFGIIRDVGSVTSKVVKLGFKAVGFTARQANNVLSYALDATKEGYQAPENNQPKEYTQAEFDFEGVENDRNS